MTSATARSNAKAKELAKQRREELHRKWEELIRKNPDGLHKAEFLKVGGTEAELETFLWSR
jgi:hypothetical protein